MGALQYISEENNKVTGVIIPIDLWREIDSEEIIKNKIVNADASEQSSWESRMRRTFAAFREGAKDYSEEEINQIVNEAVEAVRNEESKTN